MISSTKAIVLNKKNFGDTSLICNLYSHEYGKISVIAKGAKTIKNTLGAMLQPLNHIECIYYYKSKRNIQIIKEATIIDKFFDIEKDYLKMRYALTVIDIVQHIHYVESPSKIIFRLLNKVLNHINDYENNKTLLLYIFFQLQCLIYLGYYPAIEKCDQCDNKLDSASLNYQSGQLVCNQCNESNSPDLNKFNLKMIDHLMTTHIDDTINNLKFNQIELNKIDDFLYKYILYHIPDIKKSKAFLSLNNEK